MTSSHEDPAPARQRAVEGVEDGLCEDCPPIGYPTQETRCTPCPRREMGEALEAIRAAFDGDSVPQKNIALRKAHDAITALTVERDEWRSAYTAEAVHRMNANERIEAAEAAALPPNPAAAPGEVRVTEEMAEVAARVIDPDAFRSPDGRDNIPSVIQARAHMRDRAICRARAALEAALAVQPAPDTLDQGTLEAAFIEYHSTLVELEDYQGFTGNAHDYALRLALRALPSASTTAQSGMMSHMPSRERMKEIIAASPDDEECEAGVLHPEAQSGEPRP